MRARDQSTPPRVASRAPDLHGAPSSARTGRHARGHLGVRCVSKCSREAAVPRRHHSRYVRHDRHRRSRLTRHGGHLTAIRALLRLYPQEGAAASLDGHRRRARPIDDAVAIRGDGGGAGHTRAGRRPVAGRGRGYRDFAGVLAYYQSTRADAPELRVQINTPPASDGRCRCHRTWDNCVPGRRAARPARLRALDSLSAAPCRNRWRNVSLVTEQRIGRIPADGQLKRATWSAESRSLQRQPRPRDESERRDRLRAVGDGPLYKTATAASRWR